MKNAEPSLTMAMRATLMRASYGETYLARELDGRDVELRDFGAGARVLTLRLGDTYIVVPQGTEDPAAWWRNFRTRRSKIYGSTLEGSGDSTGELFGKAHQGITESYRRMADYILETSRGADRVETMGHSAGGPLAELSALALAELGLEVSNVTTCGSNRWANRRLGQCLRRHPYIGSMVRIVLDKDPVPYLPFVGSGSGRCQHTSGKDGVEDGAQVLFIDFEGHPHVDPSRWLRLKSRFRKGGSEPTADDLGAVPSPVIESLKEKGMESIDQIVGVAAGTLAGILGIPAPLAAYIKRQAQALSVGAWAVGIFDETIDDHRVATYETALMDAAGEVERVLQ